MVVLIDLTKFTWSFLYKFDLRQSLTLVLSAGHGMHILFDEFEHPGSLASLVYGPYPVDRAWYLRFDKIEEGWPPNKIN